MDRINLSKYLPRHELELFLQGKLTDAYRVFGAQFIEELGMHRFLGSQCPLGISYRRI